jgi:hypothetical protein
VVWTGDMILLIKQEPLSCYKTVNRMSPLNINKRKAWWTLMFTSEVCYNTSFKKRSIAVDCRDHRISKMSLYFIWMDAVTQENGLWSTGNPHLIGRVHSVVWKLVSGVPWVWGGLCHACVRHMQLILRNKCGRYCSCSIILLLQLTQRKSQQPS